MCQTLNCINLRKGLNLTNVCIKHLQNQIIDIWSTLMKMNIINCLFGSYVGTPNNIHALGDQLITLELDLP